MKTLTRNAGLLAICVLLSILLIGCSGSRSISSTTPPAVASITITPASSSVESGSTDQFTAMGKDSAGNTISGLTFTWASSATSVATIGNSGQAIQNGRNTAQFDQSRY